jgi:8-oxo-dGTP pyrophosphatase MutT (NUDIX family)
MAWAPHVTVAVIVERQGRFLLVEEQAEAVRLVYNQPAGHVEKAETLMQAACREALEETGWEVALTGVVGLYVYPSPHDADTTYYRVCFAAEAVRHHPERTLDDGILRAVWLTPEELTSSNKARSPLVPKCIADYMSGKRSPLDLIYEHVHEQA